ncbi:dihydrodipicolinate reductase [Pseudofrankia asymbiotica]|uniref:Dihydrodipicolinate reductase n=1 Tax=Pseudofrankia asymbiotica TaxID=1834516 RepID=A0A1V2I290_9ACTN|nr:dihydrodipicolinate reductase [Pseudofrankia asymbiotica]ONH23899.1 dihydrodipicolinate reductase [Pseudofrankia asymbiotica]
MTSKGQPLRVVQWTTGKIAREAVKSIVERPDLDLVGAYAFSVEKVGVDVGELTGLDHQLGITATDDIDALIALRPDCVVYMPLHPDVDHLVRLLRAGINVVSTASFITGRSYGAESRALLDKAATDGNVTLFGTGVNPGWAEYIATVASSPCREVSHVQVTESFNIGLWASDANQDELGWGRPAGDPGHADEIRAATAVFGDAVESIGDQLALPLDDIRCEVQFAHATADCDVPGRTVRRGTVAGLDVHWIGSAAGVDVVETQVRWTVTADLEPAWEIAMAYLVEVRGTPQIKMRIEVLPADIAAFTLEDASALGSMITAMPAVNAIPAVVAARPGIVTYADLPTIASRLVPKI